MDTLVEAFLESPLLPRQLQRLNRAMDEEHARRKRFYEEMTEDGKWEFINGEPILHSPAKSRHIDASDSLFTLLRVYAQRHDLGRVTHEKLLVGLTRNDYEPDICFFRKEVADTFAPDQMIFPAPDLVVEILSPSTAHLDRGVKKRDYAAHGVHEYWIVDPVAQSVDAHRLRGEDYEFAVSLPIEAELASVALPGFRVPVRALFDQAANVAALTALLTDPPV